MTIDRDQIRSVVRDLFAGKGTGSWTGFGGRGNPQETWKSLQTQARLSFVLDRDAIFSVASWAGARLIGQCNELVEICSQLDALIDQLADSGAVIEDTEDLHRSLSVLRKSAVASLVGSSPSAAATLRQAAKEKIVSFVSGNLAPIISPDLDGSDRLSPAEARKKIRELSQSLFDLMEKVEDGVETLSTLVDDPELGLPNRLISEILDRSRGVVEKISQKLSGLRPVARVDTAQADLVQLSGVVAALNLLEEDAKPTLLRGTYTCSAAGSGPGAVVRATLSAPYDLIRGVADEFNATIDGIAISTDLPSTPNFLRLDLPVAAERTALFPPPPPPSPGWPYVFPPGFHFLYFGVDGTYASSIVTIPAGGYTVDGLYTIITTTPGALPPHLTVSIVDLDPGVGTLRFSYNPPGGLGSGSCIQIWGAPETMQVIGFPGYEPDFPGVKIHREFWPAITQSRVMDVLRRVFADLGRVEASNTTVLAGLGELDPTVPDMLIVWRYRGTGEWDPETNRLTLRGDDLSRICPGDAVSLGALYGTVEKVEPDGVILTDLSGIPATAGSYPVGISPPSGTVKIGQTLVVEEHELSIPYRITNVIEASDGLIYLKLARGLFCAQPFATTQRISYRINADYLILRSSNNGPTGIVTLTSSGSSGIPALGFSYGTTRSMVDQLSATGADFVRDGVQPGDVVLLASNQIRYVQEVLAPDLIRLDSAILGTYTGSTRIYNRRYYAYNELKPHLQWNVPTEDEIRRVVEECVRAPGMLGAGGRLRSMLSTVSAAASALVGPITAYRQACIPLSPFLEEVREALEESGADRASEMLQTGKLTELFSATADDVSSTRNLLRSMRVLGRESLGSSVYARPIDDEVRALARNQPIVLDVSPLPEEEIGPPRSTGR